MDQEHLVIVSLVGVLFVALVLLVKCSQAKKEDYVMCGAEAFDYSKATGNKLCQLQSGYIANAPFVGGQKKRKQAYDNCMKHFYGVMPSAYVTSQFSY